MRFNTIPLKIDDALPPTPLDATLVAELNCPNATPPNKPPPNPIANATRNSRRVRKRLPHIGFEISRVVYSLSRAQRYTPAVPAKVLLLRCRNLLHRGPNASRRPKKHTPCQSPGSDIETIAAPAALSTIASKTGTLLQIAKPARVASPSIRAI